MIVGVSPLWFIFRTRTNISLNCLWKTHFPNQCLELLNKFQRMDFFSDLIWMSRHLWIIEYKPSKTSSRYFPKPNISTKIRMQSETAKSELLCQACLGEPWEGEENEISKILSMRWKGKGDTSNQSVITGQLTGADLRPSKVQRREEVRESYCH